MARRLLPAAVTAIVTLSASCGGGSTIDEAARPAATSVAAAAAEPTPSPWPGPSIDLVVVGDSFVGWSAWPEMYAALASDALGVPVALDRSLAGPGTPRRLDQISRSESAQAAITSAEILVVQPQPGWAAGPAFDAYLRGDCGGEANTDCLTALPDEFHAYANDYFDLLLDLVAPGTLIRVANTATWAPEGFYPDLREDDPNTLFRFIDAVAGMMQGSREAAAARGIPTIDVSAAFNGSDYHQQAPDDYLVADRVHLAEQGSQIVAELLHQHGYEATVTD